MPDVIQFHCPACGIALRVPPQAAGFQGPCPRCAQEIIGPDPATGTEARRALKEEPIPPSPPAAHPGADRRDDPFNPFVRSRDEPVQHEPVQHEPVQHEPVQHEPVQHEPVQHEPSPPALLAPALPTTVPVADDSKEQPLARPEPFSQPYTSAVPAAARVVPAASPSEERKLVRAIVILSSALAGVIGLIAGFVLGLYNDPEKLGLPSLPAEVSMDLPVAPEAPPKTPEELSPEPAIAAEPTAEKEEPPAPPMKVIAAPEAALKAFLSAPDWRARLKLSLNAERISPKMETYYQGASDAPIKAISIKADSQHTREEDGTKLATYILKTQEHPEGFSVALIETKEGWKVDWETFVEFDDNAFARFAAGEGSDNGEFHVLVRNTIYGKFEGGEDFTPLLLVLPLKDYSEFGYVKTNSELGNLLVTSVEPGRPAFTVLQLARRPGGPKGGTFLEITGLVAPNWWPELE